LDSSKIEPEWIESICGALILRVARNAARTTARSASKASAGGQSPENRDPQTTPVGQCNPQQPEAACNELAERQAADLGLNLEQLAEEIERAVGAAVGCDLDKYVEEFLAKRPASAGTAKPIRLQHKPNCSTESTAA